MRLLLCSTDGDDGCNDETYVGNLFGKSHLCIDLMSLGRPLHLMEWNASTERKQMLLARSEQGMHRDCSLHESGKQ
jgi:hypothetical protein